MSMVNPGGLRRQRWLLVLPSAALALVVLYGARVPILTAFGRFLTSGHDPQKADVLVVMRGDEADYDRALAVASLYSRGFAPWVYVSPALTDQGTRRLREAGIMLRSGQENIAAILEQRNVPCDRIILDLSPPGGGTVGEMERIARAMTARQFSSALIVTGWFHSRRAARIMHRVMGSTGRSAALVVADSAIGPANWWRHRYAALSVMEEYLKLVLDVVVGVIRFSDDAALTEEGEPRLAPACGGPSFR